MVRIFAVVVTLLISAAQGMPCENLSSMSIPGAIITGADLIPEGPFARPGGRKAGFGPQSNEPIPAHCRVTMVLKPSNDSNINVELWMPVENWNGKFLAVGNGGWAGSIQGYGDMQAGLRRGYATAATDTGHSAADGPMGMFALGHPEKVVDFAYRAIHDMTVKSKRLIAAYYDRPLEYSYYKGCSTGGRQGVMSAQRYPGDFDGIIAGALANRHIHMHTSSVAAAINLSRNPDQAISEVKAAMVSEAIMNKCDGLKEGFLNNPRACSFDFSTLLCKGVESDRCLTQAQLKTVETFYGGVKNSQGELIFAGQSFGNPLSPQLSTNQEPNAFIWDTVRILGFQDEDYDWRNFNLDRDMPVIDANAGLVDAINPDLRGFQGHGGKLLLYHGWGDFGIPPENTIQYYESVLEEMGDEQDDWMRLFMVPGMGHCSGGDGPHAFDTLGTLEKWREDNIAPDRIMGQNPQSGLTRPLCPFPQFADYDGSGSPADASNWSCRE